MKELIVALMAVGIVVFLPSVSSADNAGRYQVVMMQVAEMKGDLTQLPVLLDTKTGRTWYMSGSLSWYPMFIYDEKPKPVHDEAFKLGGSYTPKQ